MLNNKLTNTIAKIFVRNVCKQDALRAAFSLACLEIRSRNEEVINSTRNRIECFTSNFIVVNTFLLIRLWL